MARIAARATAANEAAKEKQRQDIARRLAKTRAKSEAALEEEDKKAAKNQILLIAGGGTLASTAFFYRNIQRLFIKITSGGADDGYSTVAEPPARGRVVRTGKKQAPPPEPEASPLDGVKKLAEFAFGRKL